MKGLLACPECDLLQRDVEVPLHCAAHCGRCGAELYRHPGGGVTTALACALAAAILLAIAVWTPIATLQLQGRAVGASLWDLVQGLFVTRAPLVGVLVLVTAILIPALYALLHVYLLLPLARGRTPRHFGALLRVLEHLRPWAMIDVVFLALLAALAKLGQLAEIAPGPALWALAALAVALTVVAVTTEPRRLWQHVARGQA